MPVVLRHNFIALSAGVAVLSGWAALLVVIALEQPLQPRKESEAGYTGRLAVSVGPTVLNTYGYSGYGLAGPLARSTGPLAQSTVTPRTVAPSLNQIRLRPLDRRGLFAGQGIPRQRIVLLRAGQTVAETMADAHGEWQIAAILPVFYGSHTFSVEQATPGGEQFAVSQAFHIHVPEGHYQTVAVDRGDATPHYQLSAVRADGDEIGAASSKKFDELLRDGALAAKEQPPTGRTAQNSDGALDPAWSWLREANRSYNQDVVPRIKRGGGYSGDGEAQEPAQTAKRADEPNPGARADRAAWRADNQADNGAGGVAGSGAALWNWFETARRGYTSEVVPRLKGQMPDVRIARPSDNEEADETEAARRARLERERRLTETAEQRAERERLEAERNRREAEERRRSAEEQAAKLAEERRRAEEGSARRLAEEQRRAVERRAEEQRLLAEERRRAEAAEREANDRASRDRASRDREERDRLAQERAAREAEIARQQEVAEQEALRRQRQAEEDAAARIEREAAERTAALAERERQARERSEQERQARERSEQERQARAQQAAERRRAQLMEQAEAIRRRREADDARRRQQQIARAEPPAEPSARPRDELPVEPVERNQPIPVLPERAPSRTVSNTETRLPDRQRFVRRDTTIVIQTPTQSPARAIPDDSSRAAAVTRPTDDKNRRQPDQVASNPNPTTAGGGNRAEIRHITRHTNRRMTRCNGNAGRTISPPGTYIVKRGDSLWTISRRHYQLGRLFPKIHRANRAKIRNVRLIYPCQRFHLPSKNDT